MSKLIVGILAVAYILFPADALPDFIPVLGWLDDLGVLGLAVAYFFKSVRKKPAP